MSALFTPIDMTDHETNFISWNELPGMVPTTRPNWLSAIQPESHPQIDAFAAIEEIEAIPRYGTSPTMKGLIDAKYADVVRSEDVLGHLDAMGRGGGLASLSLVGSAERPCSKPRFRKRRHDLHRPSREKASPRPAHAMLGTPLPPARA